jgi:hypothetical protein
MLPPASPSWEESDRQVLACHTFLLETARALIALCLTDFPLQWPAELTWLFDVQNSVGYTADSLMNLDCLLSADSAMDGTDYSFFNAAAVTIFTPFAVFLLLNLARTAVVIYLTRSVRRGETGAFQAHPTAHHPRGDIELHERVKLSLDDDRSDVVRVDNVGEEPAGASAAEVSAATENKTEKEKKAKLPSLVSRKFIAGWIIIFVTLQPALTKAVFSLFACQHLEDGTTWVRRDMQVACFSSTHKRWLFLAGIPGAILYTLGIPLGAALLLYSVRKDLEARPVKKKFGFLYSGCARFPSFTVRRRTMARAREGYSRTAVHTRCQIYRKVCTCTFASACSNGRFERKYYAWESGLLLLPSLHS